MSVNDDLTRQESNILALVAQGKRNTEIAQELYLSIRTVESHIYRIFQKLKISSRTEAAIYALESGLLSNQTSMKLRTTSETDSSTMRP
jgi:NarL family two-component system response regulator LiaR